MSLGKRRQTKQDRLFIVPTASLVRSASHDFLVGFFEGLDAERAIGWRVPDSMCLRPFLGHDLEDRTPDDSAVSRTGQRYPAEAHEELFTWTLRVLSKAG
ncbi:transposase [Candidatus Latescibacterota bacterium]